MIAPLRNYLTDSNAELKPDRFLELLPRIRRQASLAFRHLGAEARHELTQETVANAFCAFVRLAHRGKLDLVYATPLARYAIRQVRAGRRVGCQQTSQDVLSHCARRMHGFKVERLDQRDGQSGALHQLLVEDRKAGPAETAAARIDLAEWFSTLTKRNRKIAAALALGHTTKAVAFKFGISAGRVSQLRVWLREHWEHFHGDRQLVGCEG